jgi:hypothetical protein
MRGNLIDPSALPKKDRRIPRLPVPPPRSIGGNSRGGNDTLTGDANAPAPNVLSGDAGTMHGNSRGGNDTLTGGANATNFLSGDAGTMDGNARGGNDTLISGTGADHMWGDARVINGVAASPTAPTGTVVTGADTFVFASGNGNDDINDFRQSDGDKIDVSAYGFHSIADMVITDMRPTPGSSLMRPMCHPNRPQRSHRPAGVGLHICLIFFSQRERRS